MLFPSFFVDTIQAKTLTCSGGVENHHRLDLSHPKRSTIIVSGPGEQPRESTGGGTTGRETARGNTLDCHPALQRPADRHVLVDRLEAS